MRSNSGQEGQGAYLMLGQVVDTHITVSVYTWLVRTLYFYEELAKKNLPNDGHIPKTSPCNEDPLTPYFNIEKLGFTAVYIFFLFLL